MKHNPLTLNRTELIDALRLYVSPRNYQMVTYQPTAFLRGILLVHQCPESEIKMPEYARPAALTLLARGL